MCCVQIVYLCCFELFTCAAWERLLILRWWNNKTENVLVYFRMQGISVYKITKNYIIRQANKILRQKNPWIVIGNDPTTYIPPDLSGPLMTSWLLLCLLQPLCDHLIHVFWWFYVVASVGQFVTVICFCLVIQCHAIQCHVNEWCCCSLFAVQPARRI
jgi:hypothetical protein